MGKIVFPVSHYKELRVYFLGLVLRCPYEVGVVLDVEVFQDGLRDVEDLLGDWFTPTPPRREFCWYRALGEPARRGVVFELLQDLLILHSLLRGPCCCLWASTRYFCLFEDSLCSLCIAP